MQQSERQKEIIEAALVLIDTKGIQGLTIKNLSKAIGITEPAIYRHFESKNEIVLTLLDNFMEMARMLSGLMQSYSATAHEKIKIMIEKMVDLFTENPPLVSVIFSEEIFKNEQVLKKRIVEILDIHADTIENILVKGQEEGNVRKDIDSKTLGLLVMGSLRLLVKKWDLNEKNFDLRKEGEKLVDAIGKILDGH
jgi:AcrR family transcriptional regulator